MLGCSIAQFRTWSSALRILTIVVMSLLTFPSDAFATDARRHAIVIGIDNYDFVEKLQKARNDAVAVAEMLERTGFEVTTVLDPSRQELNFALAHFVEQLGAGDEAVFFFAGHGVEIDGRNYLLPADIPTLHSGQQTLLISESLPVDRVLQLFRERETRVSLLILDACRDNPFPRQGTRSVGASRGLGRVEAPEGTFVMFSAGIGQTALDRLSDDDENPNSVFTRRLLPLLEEPGLHITELARRVRVDVMELAQSVDHDQRPAFYDEITGNFAFVPAAMRPSIAPAVETPDPCAAARSVWATIDRIDSRSAVKAFIELHADCAEIVAVAQERLLELPAEDVDDGATIAWELVRETNDPLLLERFAATNAASRFASEARARARALRSALLNPEQRTLVLAFPLPEEIETARSEALHIPPDPPTVGPTVTYCDDCPEMVLITGTEVLYGAPEAYRIVQRDERPPLRLNLPEPFAVALTETTRAEYQSFIDATGHVWPDACVLHLPGHRIPVIGSFAEQVNTDPDLPAVCVSWDDAQAYVAWLSERTGQRFRLLTEFEFEYLAEAFHFNMPLEQRFAGLDLCEWVNIADRGSEFSWRDFSCEQPLGSGVLPVRALKPDAFGLYHLLGNVWEWVQDCYAETPEMTMLRRTSGEPCDRRSMRGGSWTDPLETLRSSNRNWDRPDYRADNIGFRVALDP